MLPPFPGESSVSTEGWCLEIKQGPRSQPENVSVVDSNDSRLLYPHTCVAPSCINSGLGHVTCLGQGTHWGLPFSNFAIS